MIEVRGLKKTFDGFAALDGELVALKASAGDFAAKVAA